ncbi:two-component system sensor histidine kinase DesK [Streptosporangium album]|uniref:Two-component system sensor histidine kinase DesK n=1 Tax=Streptosporangium album TaxID=47479 RepID=A0A7W7WCE1_9ACTN|nr:histidine kinase [Streptosporangium album]MBB4941144.1 two-component system sensor histidine kinase DesK [Streptosporangium album]
MRTNPQRLTVGIVYTISIGFTASMLTVARTPMETAILAAASIAFLVPHHLQIRAALRGGEQRGVPVALIVQAVATYAPIPYLASLWIVLGYNWATTMPTILSGAVLVRLRPRFAVPIAAAIGAFSFWLGISLPPPYGSLTVAAYNLITVVVTGGVTYAAVRLVVVSRELEQARTELAEAAVLRERLRISRDLHDGLGSSLTAVALKGDLARRLVERDPEAARAELAELVHVARDAAQDVRQVARGYREMSLAEEVHRAVALLEASGVSCQTNLADLRVSRPVDEALAWAVREGTTNVVRHSHATTCSISTSVGVGTVRLELVNDRARKGSADGNGLTGLRERVGGLGGSVSAERTGSGGFRLVTEVPA